MTTKLVLLGEYAKVIGGYAFKSEDFTEEGIPIIRISDLQNGSVSIEKAARIQRESMGKGESYCINPGDILVAMSGATTGKIGFVPRKFNGLILQNQRVGNFKITNSEKLCQEYLKHFVCSPLYQRQLCNSMAGAAQPNISSKQLENIEIPLPSLEEQKRIAEILDRAESLRAMRRQSIEQLNTLPEAIFLKMFGDPLKNPKNLSVEPLGDFLLFMTSGGRGWAQFYAQSGSRFIRSLDVQMNYIGDEDIAFVAPPDNAEARRTRVKTGDVLLTITGSRIGRVAAVPDELAKSYVSQHVAILRTDPNRISPMFLAFFLNLSTGGQRQITKYQYGQTKPGLNFEQIKRFQIPLPSINLQQEFTQRVNAIEKLKAIHQKSLTELDALFASLQHRAFRGEL